jgi:NADPH:quinone reductase-like Zn-dependent oxidoreductase
VLGAASLRKAGAFAEMVTADQKQVVKMPAGLSFEEAATLPTVGVAALQALIDKGELTAGQSVFITGCLGGVGRTAVQIARMRGASVAGSCRDSATAEARALGVDPVVGFDFDPAPLKGRFDLILDTAGATPSGRQVAPAGWQCPAMIERRRLCHLKHRKPALRPRVPRP